MRFITWGLGFAIWAAFSLWYTNLGGPLTAEEVDHYVDAWSSVNPGVNADRLRDFLAADTGKQFIMVNLIDMAGQPPDVDGAEPGESADELLGRYMAHMFPALLQRACHPVYLGEAIAPALDLVGIDGAEVWTRAALMRYRSRRDLAEIATNPAFAGRHEFKLAALDKTIAVPVENSLYLSDPRLLLALALFSLCAAVQLIIAGHESRRY